VTKSFTAEVERAGKTSARFPVPFDLKGAFGRARPPVRVTIRGHTWRTTPGVYGGVGYIGRVRVTMEVDTEPRTIEPADDLRAALEAAPGALARFAGLSFTYRREYVEWVEGAKRTETRAKRIAETVRRVRAGEAPP